MTAFTLDFAAAGGNTHSSAADWKSGLLVFGAGKNLALWQTGIDQRTSINSLRSGHSDDVNAVKIWDHATSRRLITGSSDKSIRIWEQNEDAGEFEVCQCLEEHSGSINTLCVLSDIGLLVSGSADGTVKVWDSSGSSIKLCQSMTLKPRYIPLSCSATTLQDGSSVLAVAGTSNLIQLYVRTHSSKDFCLQATLTGHEGWIRSLDFTNLDNGDLLLASASQDKYIRLWRFARSVAPTTNGSVEPKPALSNKAHTVGSADEVYTVTFEALLIGHEDWIYTVRWAPPESKDNLRLLSASADNSLAIWRPDETSGVWVCQTRLGEISSQKGSTTATGSTGGFWIGLWQPNGLSLASLGRTGSWRRWKYDDASDIWQQCVGIGGHVKEVQGIAWAPDGSYLLSTASDQTTRLWTEWKNDGRTSWHEFARPQIHGYDLNCLDALTTNQFLSGADEKLLRVFNKPRAIGDLLSRLCEHDSPDNNKLPDAANIPVLGLSNKAIASAPDDDPSDAAIENGEDGEATDPASIVRKSTLDLDHPPYEDHLARHTLWPEHEKLYGHGYEISAVAASPDGSVVATACKASSLDHALIRLYECKEWREVKPSLKVHSLTVTSLAFSADGKWLLSVGRDRLWALFRREESEQNQYTLFKSQPKGHSRMILDCCWAPVNASAMFATSGRDKAVKIWRIEEDDVQMVASITANAAATAVNISPSLLADHIRLAYGTEDGEVSVVTFSVQGNQIVDSTPLARNLHPSAAVNALRWRPSSSRLRTPQLAIASDDCSVRVVSVEHAAQ